MEKVVLYGVGVSLRGAPLLAEASLRGARLSGTSLSRIIMPASASLYGASLEGTLGFTDTSPRGASLSGSLLLAGVLLYGQFERSFVAARHPVPLKKETNCP